jgi:hypothetical protein
MLRRLAIAALVLGLVFWSSVRLYRGIVALKAKSTLTRGDLGLLLVVIAGWALTVWGTYHYYLFTFFGDALE